MSPPPMESSPHIVLVGGMGVGKTSIGKALATRLDRPFLDSDDHVMAVTGASGRQVTTQHGVGALHQLEAEHLLAALASQPPAVIAAAASVVDGDRCVAALEAADVVWLRAAPDIAVERMGQSSHRRDLGPDVTEAVTALADRRAPRYEHVADLTIDTDDVSPDGVVAQIQAWLLVRYE